MPSSAHLPSHPFSVVALDVGGTKIAGALVTYPEKGARPEVSCPISVPTDAARGGAAVLDDMVEVARTLIAQATCPVIGIGAYTAGVVDPERGSIAYANQIMPGWTGRAVARHLASEFDLPVSNMGDVHAHALGEARWGAACGLHSCLMVGIGTGLGGAFVLDGKVLRGFRGAAGHIGHTLHHLACDLPCACGGASHAETVTSGTALCARYQGKNFGDELDPSCMGAEIARRAETGDDRAAEAIEFAGDALGQAIGSWCNVLDPEAVVLSGSVVNAGPRWRYALEQGFQRQALTPLSDTRIIEGALGASAPLIGAAENLLDSIDASAKE
ncbi:MAG: ROK family protein [Berryella intestinalis]|nr:ROK family protein [Berryella intestinalis]